MRWVTREIQGPDRDTLSAAEVAVYLGYSDPKKVVRLVKEGKFPQPIEEDGIRKWFWEDVVWYVLHKRVRPRLRPAPPGEEFPTPPPDAAGPKNRPK